MAANDYHVIVYQILAYLYAQLKKGKSVDPEMLKYDGSLFSINKTYWVYILKSLQDNGYVTGLRFVSVNGETNVFDLESCQITPQGISYVCDDYMLEKARDYARENKNIPEVI